MPSSKSNDAFGSVLPRTALVSAMIERLWRWISLFLILALLLGCDKNSQNTDASSELILAVVRAQIKALNRRDANAALALMHPQAPGLARTRETTEQVTATYDLIYMLQNLALESVNEHEATVRFTQITQKASGPEFRNNRVAGLHTLRKSGGIWKLYYTQVLHIEYLDK